MTLVTRGMPFATYRSLSGEHATALRLALDSPLAYRRHIDAPQADTDAMLMGRAIHARVLEPMCYDVGYAVWQGGAKRGKDWEVFLGATGGQEVITAAQSMIVDTVAESMFAHPRAGELLSQPGETELTIVWTHAITGKKIKCRIDKYTETGCLVDVKTTRDPSRRAFAAACARYGYAMQLALYHDALDSAGMTIAGMTPRAVKIIAAQSVEPYDTVVYTLDAETIEIGRGQYERALETVVMCEATGCWPGQEQDEVVLRLPAWADSAESAITLDGEPLWRLSPATNRPALLVDTEKKTGEQKSCQA